MVKFHTHSYTFLVHLGSQPEVFDRWMECAGYTDLQGLADRGTPVYIGVEEAGRWEMMVIVFNTEPIDERFFHPELFYLPETETLFVGAGRKAMTYSLKEKLKLTDRDLVGFWSWSKHERFVIMVEELGIAVYDTDGSFVWETFAEPPWTYGIEGNILTLDIMGAVTKYELDTGKPIT